jgi:hypothetical protein
VRLNVERLRRNMNNAQLFPDYFVKTAFNFHSPLYISTEQIDTFIFLIHCVLFMVVSCWKCFHSRLNKKVCMPVRRKIYF